MSYYIIHISEEKQELEEEFKSVDVDASGIAERFVFVFLSVCLFVYPSVFLYVCISLCLSVCMSLCLSVFMSLCLSVCRVG